MKMHGGRRTPKTKVNNNFTRRAVTYFAFAKLSMDTVVDEEAEEADTPCNAIDIPMMNIVEIIHIGALSCLEVVPLLYLSSKLRNG